MKYLVCRRVKRKLICVATIDGPFTLSQARDAASMLGLGDHETSSRQVASQKNFSGFSDDHVTHSPSETEVATFVAKRAWADYQRMEHLFEYFQEVQPQWAALVQDNA